MELLSVSPAVALHSQEAQDKDSVCLDLSVSFLPSGEV